MEITSIAGFAVITQNAQQSAKLYKDDLGLPLQGEDEYLAMDRFPGTNHFGIWPLHLAAESCFGTGDWPDDVPVPSSTIEYELASVSALTSAVIEMEAKGYTFVHGARRTLGANCGKVAKSRECANRLQLFTLAA